MLAPLARGGMAELFLARQAGPEGFEKTLAVKRLLPAILFKFPCFMVVNFWNDLIVITCLNKNCFGCHAWVLSGQQLMM